MASGDHDLERFIEAQAGIYDIALSEIRHGEKRSHWMWYVIPHIAGLGSSPMSQRYAIRSIDEARAYLDHPILGARLRECIAALAALPPDIGRTRLRRHRRGQAALVADAVHRSRRG